MFISDADDGLSLQTLHVALHAIGLAAYASIGPDSTAPPRRGCELNCT